MTVTVTLPLSLKNPLNAREHWAVKAKRAKSQRAAVTLVLRTSRVQDKLQAHEMAGGLASPKGPLVVTMTRVYVGKGRAMDDDGLSAALKHVRDAIAAHVGIDDADPRVTWRCLQERGAKASKASVRIAFDTVAVEQPRALVNELRR